MNINKNAVSYQTGLKLKEAGFPQPLPEWGQTWGFIRFPEGTARHEKTGIVLPYRSDRKLLFLGDGEYEEIKPSEQVFCPTVEYILILLGSEYSLSFNGRWFVTANYPNGSGFYLSPEDPNPAEVAAEAWLRSRNVQGK